MDIQDPLKVPILERKKMFLEFGRELKEKRNQEGNSSSPTPEEIVEYMRTFYWRYFDDCQKLYQLSLSERQQKIRLHEWVMGEKRFQSGDYRDDRVGEGIAVLDYVRNVLNKNISELPLEVINKMELDRLYHHCELCGYVFKDDWVVDNLIGTLPKNLDNPAYMFFNITSGLCNYCEEQKRLDREVKKITKLFT